MYDFAELVKAELESARRKHPDNPSRVNCHYYYALILEELDEFWDEVKKKSSKRSPANMLTELVQIAAMCQRAAEDLKLVGEYDLPMLQK